MKTFKSFKRGATFALHCTWKINKVPTPIDGLVIQSQVRKPTGELIASLQFVPDTSNNTKFTLVPVVADTAGWPIGLAVCDIKTTLSGIVRSSETFQIIIVERVTE